MDFCASIDRNLDPQGISFVCKKFINDGELWEDGGSDILPGFGHKIETSKFASLTARDRNGIFSASILVEILDPSTIISLTVFRDVRKAIDELVFDIF